MKLTLLDAQVSLAKILPEELRPMFYQKSYIAGGSLYSLFNDKPVKDYDFFLIDSEFPDILVDYFLEYGHIDKIKWNESPSKKTIIPYNGINIVMTDRAITFGQYQIITKWTGTPRDVVNSFDFLHTMSYYRNNKIVTLTPIENIITKQLRFNENRARNLVNAFSRMTKFLDRGMTISKTEVLKMLCQLNKNGFKDEDIKALSSLNNTSEEDYI